MFGHDRVWVLDGGLPRWRASGYDVESSASGDAILKASAASEAIEKVYQGQAVSSLFIHLVFNFPLSGSFLWDRKLNIEICSILGFFIHHAQCIGLLCKSYILIIKYFNLNI